MEPTRRDHDNAGQKAYAEGELHTGMKFRSGEAAGQDDFERNERCG